MIVHSLDFHRRGDLVYLGHNLVKMILAKCMADASGSVSMLAQLDVSDPEIKIIDVLLSMT